MLELHALTPRAGSAVFALLAAVSLLNLVQYYFSAIYIARNDFDRGVLLQAGALVLQIGSIAAALACGAAPLAVAALALAGMLISVVPALRSISAAAIRTSPGGSPCPRAASSARVPERRCCSGALGPASPCRSTRRCCCSATREAAGGGRRLYGRAHARRLLRQLAQQLALASGVEMARQAAQTDLAALRGLAMTTGRVLAGLIGLLAGGLWVAAEPALRFWTQGQVAYEPWLIGALLATILVITPAQVATSRCTTPTGRCRWRSPSCCTRCRACC